MDSLFKKKLDEHQLPPREDAWARVESNLSKKNNFFAWRIAAAILIAGALITTGVWMMRKDEKPTLVKKSESNKPSTTADSVAAKKKTPGTPDQKEKKESNEGFTASRKNYSTKKRNVAPAEKKEESLIPALNKEEETSVKEIAVVDQNLKSDATVAAQTTSSVKEKPIVLEFTLEEVAAETAVAKTETKNSGLKKMLDAARQIKNGEGPVNQLLEKKDELFALNFKKEKQKTQH